MSADCSICQHMKVSAINQALVLGKPYRAILTSLRETGHAAVSLNHLRRHQARCLDLQSYEPQTAVDGVESPQTLKHPELAGHSTDLLTRLQKIAARADMPQVTEDSFSQFKQAYHAAEEDRPLQERMVSWLADQEREKVQAEAGMWGA